METKPAWTRRKWLARMGAGVALGALANSPAASAEEPSLAPAEPEQKAIRDLVEEFRARFKAPGFSLAISRLGVPLFAKAYGLADAESRTPLLPTHLFRIASVSKPVTSVTIYTLLGQGRLRLGDRVFGSGALLGTDYGTPTSERVKAVTVEHLLTHTAGGWSNKTQDPMFRDKNLPMGRLIRDAIAGEPLTQDPGSDYAYSNFGYCVLGRVVAKLTGDTYEEGVKRLVLQRCSIAEMAVGGSRKDERLLNEVAYFGQDGEDPYNYNIGRMDAHGGWLATPTALVRFASAVDGFAPARNILPKEAITSMTTPSKASASYAKGWGVNTAGNWWHLGSLPGTSSILVRSASGLCWAALVNTRTGEINNALDELMWKVVKAVPAWRA